MPVPDAAKALHDRQPKVVGIGASAGGLEALRAFFEEVPAESGAAYVVIMHLAPDPESHLAELLGAHAHIPAVAVHTRTRIEADHLYVIPSNRQLVVEDGHLEPRPFEHASERRFTLDLYFRTHARNHGDGVAVILSGGGSDGTMGVKDVKEAGGLVFVQDPAEAEFDAMPRSAVATGVADFVLPVREIARRVVSYVKAAADEAAARPETLAEAEAEGLQLIFAAVRARTGQDFGAYKRSTILRRIARRMQAHGMATFADYLHVLRADPEEAPALQRNLLISVTNFFRDRDAFEVLETDVIPRLFEGKREEDQIRVWSVGCATGEEAYSVAILLMEEAARRGVSTDIQVFASDLSETPLQLAREALYPLAIAEDVSAERLERFFSHEGDFYRVRPEVRERVLFAQHSVIKDPPFSRLDLILCRNLLIYLNREPQQQAFELFHYALRPGGYLFLGSAESAEVASDLFVPLRKKQRIYCSRAHVSGPTRVPALAPSTGGSFRGRMQSSLDVPPRVITSASAAGRLHQSLLETLAPPSILVNDQHEIINLSETAGRYLVHPAGPPTHNLLKLIRPELQVDLRTALFAALEHGKTTGTGFVSVEMDGRPHQVHLMVRPGPESAGGGGLALVLFSEAEGSPAVPTPTDRTADPVVQALEGELVQMKERLRLTIEEYETSSEEMKAANEELQSINEEYKSTLEELETSKEELQSVNEELQTVNGELRANVDALGKSNSDLQNLMAATEIATLFLDRQLVIRWFTPRASDLFHLLASDRGRPITHVTHRLRYDSLVEDAQRVLMTLVPVERAVESEEGGQFLAQIRPYRTVQDRIDGVVLTFVEVTALRQAEHTGQRATAALEASEERHRLIVAHVREYAIFTLDRDRRVTSWNEGAQRILGYSEDEAIGMSGDQVFTDDDRVAGVAGHETSQAATYGQAVDERWHQRKDGSRFWGSGMITALRNPDGTLGGYIKIMRDETSRRQAEQALLSSELRLRRSEEQLRMAVQAGRMGVWVWEVEPDVFRRLHFHPSLLKPGDDRPQPLAGFLARIHFEDRARVDADLRAALTGGARLDIEYRTAGPDGLPRWIACTGEVVCSDDGAPTHLYGVLHDVTAQHEPSDALPEHPDDPSSDA